MTTSKTYNVEELSEVLGFAPATIKRLLTTAPDKLPPRLRKTPKRLTWSVDEVKNWLDQTRPQLFSTEN